MPEIDLRLRLLVSDKGATFLDTEDEDRLRELISEAVRFERARAIEVREVTVRVALLDSPQPVAITETKPELVVAQDIRVLIEAAMKQQHIQDINKGWDLVMDALTPGLYRVKKESGMRGISRVEEK